MNHSELSHMAGAVDDSTINIVVVIIIIIIKSSLIDGFSIRFNENSEVAYFLDHQSEVIWGGGSKANVYPFVKLGVYKCTKRRAVLTCEHILVSAGVKSLVFGAFRTRHRSVGVDDGRGGHDRRGGGGDVWTGQLTVVERRRSAATNAVRVAVVVAISTRALRVEQATE